MINPYLPTEMRAVVDKVDTVFASRPTDKFEVFFAYGTYEEVSQRIADDQDQFPMIYLVMPFVESRGRETGIFADITARILIVVPTDPNYKQSERDSETILPRLIPVYEELMNQIHLHKMFSTLAVDKIPNDRIIRPYNAMADPNGTKTENLFKLTVDWIDIVNLKIKLRFKCP